MLGFFGRSAVARSGEISRWRKEDESELTPVGKASVRSFELLSSRGTTPEGVVGSRVRVSQALGH
jgi:hypothetical protein